jgi:hypothetical protein
MIMNIRVSTISNAWYVMVSLLARESCQLLLDMPDWRVMNRLLKKTHMLLPIAPEFCRRVRLASEVFLTSL